MGLKLAFNLYAAPAASVTEVLRQYYRQNGWQSLQIYRELYGRSDIHETLTIYNCPPHWTIVDIALEPEYWIRQRHLFVSKALRCPGFFLFEYDGDYWGYEFFDAGEVLDRFTSNASYRFYFEGMDCTGNAAQVTDRLPFLSVGTVEPYLVRLPDFEVTPETEYDDFQRQTDGMPRPGDPYKRWDEGALLNFLRALKVHGDFTGKWGQFKLSSPLYAEIDATDFQPGEKDT